MTIHVALLRGINVGGNKLAMADLRDLFQHLGFQDARTLLQTGNVVFHGDGRSAEELERLLETEAVKRLSLKTEFHVRTAREMQAAIAANPFPEEAERDPAHLVALFLKAAPAAGDVAALQDAITGPEVVRAVGRQAYIVYPDGIGRSRLSNSLIDRKLGRGTARNWNTVLKLGALAAGG